jgi:hypothetical protein
MIGLIKHKILIYLYIIHLLKSSTCFEHCPAHLQEVYVVIAYIIIIFNLCTPAFKAYCAIWVGRFNFRHQASPRLSPRESTQRRKVELWARNVREFCLNADLHVTFRDPLHAVKLRHGTDGFTSGCEPANLGTKGQHAISRPPKPLNCIYAASGTVTL